MRPLTIVVTTGDAERLRGALMLASAQAAMGGAARLFLQLDAITLLRAPIAAAQDDAHRAKGLPTLAALLDEALAIGVDIIACQSGLALNEMTAAALPEGVETGGPIGVLAQVQDDDRLLIA